MILLAMPAMGISPYGSIRSFVNRESYATLIAVDAPEGVTQ